MKKIYRIEMYGCTDTCGECWKYFPLSEYYSNKEQAEKKLKELNYGVTLNGHRPEIVEATLIENE